MVKDVHPNVHGCSSGALKGMNLKMHLFQDFYSTNYNMILTFIFLTKTLLKQNKDLLLFPLHCPSSHVPPWNV